MKIVSVEPLGIPTDMSEEIIERFSQSGHNFFMYADRKEDAKTLIQRVGDADIMVVSNIPVTREIILSCPQLKLINVAFTGVDHIDLETCREKGIVVCNAAGYSTQGVAELTIGLMIDGMRRISETNDACKKGLTRNGFLGTELFGKTVGLIGTGAIGSHIAGILLAMGCKVLAWSRTKRDEFIQLGGHYCELDDLLEQSDVVSLHVPFNESTRHLIDKQKLKLMKSNALLVNTARGGVIDNGALAEALKTGVIGAAALDVYDVEPPLPMDYPLLNVPNIIMTPHIAYATKESMIKRAFIVEENIWKWIQGIPQNIIG